MFSPTGKKVRSKAELARELGDNFDLTMFDFRTGKHVQSSMRKSRRMKGSSFDYSRGTCMCLDKKEPIGRSYLTVCFICRRASRQQPCVAYPSNCLHF